jgi:hypothetical protein
MRTPPGSARRAQRHSLASACPRACATPLTSLTAHARPATRPRPQENTARDGASCAEAEDAYASEDEKNYVVVGGDADADEESYDEDEDEDDGPPAFGGMMLRLKTKAPRRRASGAPGTATANGTATAAHASDDADAAAAAPAPPPGWTRSEVPRKSVEGSDVYYRSPCGASLRSMPEVAKWLARNREAYPSLSIDAFSFLKSSAYGARPPAGRKAGCVGARLDSGRFRDVCVCCLDSEAEWEWLRCRAG